MSSGTSLRRYTPARARRPRWMSPKRRAFLRANIPGTPSSDYPDALGVGSPMLAPEAEYATSEAELEPSTEVADLSMRFGELEAELEELEHAVDVRRGAR